MCRFVHVEYCEHTLYMYRTLKRTWALEIIEREGEKDRRIHVSNGKLHIKAACPMAPTDHQTKVLCQIVSGGVKIYSFAILWFLSEELEEGVT